MPQFRINSIMLYIHRNYNKATKQDKWLRKR